mmetsp:Transcript_140758/g.350904  ORF Transcript_140758/g.350904 Transcript_140758/m.350904 type:complete len:369 (-) Transcript_140758:173-1279(-)
MEAKKWDGDGVPLAESNCAGIGSAEDKAVRLEAAKSEPAWADAGKEPGVQVWRIENFKVVPRDKSTYGKFHSGDSYIVLHTVKGEKEFEYHIFFWLGQNTTTDEMGVAAYKTVELDNFFEGKPTQSREVQGSESKQFRALFPKIMYLEGGVDSGFHHTITDVWEARLFQVRKTKEGVVEKEVTLKRDSLNQGDCFVLDNGKRIYIWHGNEAQPLERYESNTLGERLENQRLGHAEATHDIDDKFWELLGGEGPVKSAAEADDRIPPVELGEGVLFKLTDTSGELQMIEVGRGDLHPSMLDSNDVMILDHQTEVFIWVGLGADEVERMNAFRTAWTFLKTNGRDPNTPIHMYKEGSVIKNALWNKIFAD